MTVEEADYYYDHLVRWAVTSYEFGCSWGAALESMRDEARDLGLNLSLQVTENLLDLAKLEWRKSK